MDAIVRAPPPRPAALPDAAMYMASSSSRVKGWRDGGCRNGIEVDGFGGVTVAAETEAGTAAAVAAAAEAAEAAAGMGAEGVCCTGKGGAAVGGTAVVACE